MYPWSLCTLAMPPVKSTAIYAPHHAQGTGWKSVFYCNDWLSRTGDAKLLQVRALREGAAGRGLYR